VPATWREVCVEPEAEVSKSAPLVTVVYFLASAAGSPLLREPVLEFPQTHDGASILELALAQKFLAVLLLPWAWVLVLPHSAADAALELALARKFLATLLSPEARVLVLPGLAADAALELALARKFLATLLSPWVWVLVLPGLAADAALRSALASLGLLGHYAELAWPWSPASPPEPALWRCRGSQKEALRKASFRAGSVERASFLESLPWVQRQEEYLRWESSYQVSLN
jgi:hypothetical protein